MKDIRINLSLPSKSELQGNLNNLLSKVQDTKLDLKFDINSGSLKGITDDMSALQKKMREMGDFKILSQGNSMVDGKLTSEFVEIEDKMGNIIRLTEKQGSVFENTLVPIEKMVQAEKKYEEAIYKSNDALDVKKMKLQQTLDGLYKNGVLTEQDLKNSGLDNAISNINLGTSGTEIEKIKQQLSGLVATEKEIINTKKQQQSETAKIVSDQLKLKDAVEKTKTSYLAQLDVIEKQNKAFLESSKGAGLKSQIEGFRDELNNLNPNSLNELNTFTNKLGASVKTTKADISSMGKEWSLATKNANSFSGAVGEAFKKIGIFSIGYNVISGIGNEFRQGIQSVIDMDSALSNLNKVVDLSKSQMNQMRDSAVDLGKELGRSSVDVANGMAEFGRQYKDLQQISEMTRSSIIGANVMDGLGADQVAKGLTTIISALKLEANDAMTILDSMNEVQNNYRISATDMLSALGEVSSTAKTAGASLQELEGYITAISVSTGESGSEVGNALRSITSRIYKLGAEGLESEGKPEKMLNEMGVAVRDLEGEFRPLNEILSDLSIKWKDMNDTQKIATAQTVAGVQRYNQFLALMNNFDMAVSATSTAMDSMGSATKENEIYLQSIEGRMASLKATSEGFYYNLIGSDAIKGGVSALTGLINVLDGMQKTFGSLSLVVGATTSAFLMFTNNPLKEFSNEIVRSEGFVGGFKKMFGNVVTDVGNASGVINKTKAGISSLGVSFNTAGLSAIAASVKVAAFQAVLSLGLSLAITAVIGGITWLAKEVANAGNTMEECDGQAKTLSETLNSINTESDLVSQYEKLNGQLKDTALSADNIKSLNEQITQVKAQLGADEDYYWILNDETKTLEQQLQLMKDIRQERVEKEAKDLNKDMMSQTEIEQYANQVKADAEEWNVLEKAINSANEKGKTTYKGFTDSAEALQKKQKEVEERLKSNSIQIEKYNGNLNLINQSGIDTNRTQVSLASSITSVISLIRGQSDAIKDNTKAKEENTNTEFGSNDTSNQLSDVEKLTRTYEGLGYSVDDAKKKIEELNNMSVEDKNNQMVADATTAYGNAISSAKDLEEMINKVNEASAITPELAISLASKYPEIGSRITDVASVQQFLNDKISESVVAQQNALVAMVANDQSYFDSKIRNNNELANSFNQLCKTFVDNNGKSYDLDIKNYSSLQEMKNDLTNKFGEGIATFVTNFVKAQGDGYSVDLQNTSSWASSKAQILNDLNNQIAKVKKNLSNLVSDIAKTDSALSSEGLNQEKLYTKQLAQLDNLMDKHEEIQTQFSSYDFGFAGYTPTFSTGDFTGSDGSSSGSGSTEKTVADLQLVVDRYRDLQHALEEINDELSKYDILSKNANDEDKIKYAQKEIELLNQKKKALEDIRNEQIKEQEDLKKALSGEGFKFDGENDITNANARLKELEKWANNATGDEKERRQNIVKSLQEMVKSYDDVHKSVSSTNNEILDIQNDIIDSQKEIAEVIKNEYEEWKESEEKKTDKLKEEIQKRKDIMNKQWEEEDYSDQLDQEQSKLNELQSARADALRTGNEELVKSLDSQISEQQKAINDLIREQERNNANDKYDEVLDSLDKQLEEKLNAMDDKMQDDVLLGRVQSGAVSLSDIFGQINTSSDNLNKNMLMVGDSINSWNTNLDSFISKMNTIQPNLALSLNGSIDGVLSKSNGQPIFNIETKIEVSGGTCLDEETLGGILDERDKQITKQINDSFKR